MLENLHENHRQRVRKAFMNIGLDEAAPHKALELLLFYSIPRQDTNVLAHNLIKHFGSISSVFDASLQDLIKVKGVGENTAILIKLIPILHQFYLSDKTSPGNMLNSVEAIGEYLKPKFIGMTNEVVFLACLDNKKKLLCCEQMAEGTVNSVPIITRRIAETCIRVSATYVVLAHNHPNGFALPSNDDVMSTRNIRRSLNALGIELLDHIVVSNDDFVSMANSGYFKEY